MFTQRTYVLGEMFWMAEELARQIKADVDDGCIVPFEEKVTLYQDRSTYLLTLKSDAYDKPGFLVTPLKTENGEWKAAAPPVPLEQLPLPKAILIMGKLEKAIEQWKERQFSVDREIRNVLPGARRSIERALSRMYRISYDEWKEQPFGC